MGKGNFDILKYVSVGMEVIRTSVAKVESRVCSDNITDILGRKFQIDNSC